MNNHSSQTKNKRATINDFDSITLKLASPERIQSWSYGEVTKPETINYRTQRSEKNGLFDEKIFGPEKDYECYCGKYRGIRYKGIVCEKCGVEITRSVVRRERMGHIKLATPVSHIWFLRGIPSRISLILGIPMADLEKVMYFSGYIITRVDEDERERLLKEVDSEYKGKVKELGKKEKEELKERLETAKREIKSVKEGMVLNEVDCHKYSLRYGSLFESGIGAEAVYEIFKQIDLNELEGRLLEAYEKAGAAEKQKLNKRISLIQSLIAADLRPEWMFLTHIPIIPPALRPMVPLDGGRYATSDVNDLYRRVINRNNRLKKLKDIQAPEVILRNEKRILQEAVDALIDNSMRQGSAQQAGGQAQRGVLKSLADNLKGKRGILRRSLLGKRVDYSGRSVIVIGPELSLNECGLPKHMALELFKPFVISGLLKREMAYNIRGASRLIEEGVPEVWEILEEVIKGKYVLLNRAPTLHRLGIQAFKPLLIEGNAIQIHPLVCPAFNADFDGDMMAVHVPLSEEAQFEAKEIMASDKNILKPGSGDPIISSKLLDIVLGCYWMTKILEGEKGEGKIFSSPNEAINAYDFGHVGFRANIKVLASDKPKYAQYNQEIFETSVGRLLFNSVLPSDFPFVNMEVDRKEMAHIVDDLIEKYGIENIPTIMDKIKNFGFKYATYSGITWGIDEVRIPEKKADIIAEAKAHSDKVMEQYETGLLSANERIRKNIEIWHKAKNDIEAILPETFTERDSAYDMWQSGARGSLSQITQMAGMKGLIQKSAGDTMEFPILSCSKEGLSPIEYFITTHGSRKGQTDTALRTAQAGYLTRRLFDVSQDVIVREEDCGTKEGLLISKKTASGISDSIVKIIKGRFLAEDVKDASGKVLFKKGHFLDKDDAVAIEEAGIEEVTIRSPLLCKSKQGICVKCYGVDFGNNKVIEIGEAVGTVAAQAIGEPGTQLTMRTFHAGGAASVGGDITQGLPRVEEVFEKRKPKNPAAVSRVSGVVTGVKETQKGKVITVLPEVSDKRASAKSGSEVEHTVSSLRVVLVKENQQVEKGDIMTDGSADLDELFKYAGKVKTQEYIISEISKLYELQGESVSRKHIEVVVKQMFSRRRVKQPGDSTFMRGEIVEDVVLEEEKNKIKKAGGEELKSEPVIMGITEVALTRNSFLSAASFQNTTRVLTESAVQGRRDDLVGLKENVIIGRLIPAGTGFEGSRKANSIEKLKEELTEARELGEEEEE
ncbi:MAG: DNA-directed RNA polymerase subunit beta' [Candidatus Paceibacterota bacterium]